MRRTHFLERMQCADEAERFVLALFPPPADKYGTDEHFYTYDSTFVGPDPQVDPVLVGIRTTIQVLQCEVMRFATVDIRVCNLTLCPPIWPVNDMNAEIPIKMYAFRKTRDEFPRAVAVSVANRDKGGVLTPARILVSILGEWRPIKEWLKEWVGDGIYWISDLVAQQKWWKNMRLRRGKYFPFWTLPVELQFLILQYALGGDIRPHETHDSKLQGYRVVFGSLHENSLAASRVDRNRHGNLINFDYIPFPNHAVFQVNKQFRDKAMTAGWVGSQKHFVDHSCLKDVVECLNPPPIANWLSKVYLDFSSMTKYFEMFGVSARPAIRIESAGCPAEVLQRIGTLEELTFDFPSPR